MKSSTKRSMVIAGGLVLIIGVSGAIFTGCSNTTKGEEGPARQTQGQSQQKTQQTQQAQPKAQTQSAPKSVAQSPSSVPSQMPVNTPNTVVPPAQTQQPVEAQQQPARQDVSLSNRKKSDNTIIGEYKAAAVLINKYSILYNGQFQYIFELRLTNGNGTKVVNYYTTKNVHDVASIGDTYKVTYGGDTDGNLAIRTISQ